MFTLPFCNKTFACVRAVKLLLYIPGQFEMMGWI